MNSIAAPVVATRASSSHHVHPDQGLPVDVVGVVNDVDVLGVVEVGVVVVPDGLPTTAVGCAGVMVNGNDVTTVAVSVLGMLSKELPIAAHPFAIPCLNVAMLMEVVPDMVPDMVPGMPELPLVPVPLRPVTVNGSTQFVKLMGEVVLSTM